MKCAMEMIATATVVAEEKAKAEELRKAKERKEQQERTLKFCEQLGEKLEKKVANGEYPTISFYCDKWYRPLKATYLDYADGRMSYKRMDSEFDVFLLSEWFENYCFEIIQSKFSYWEYGLGRCNGYEIKISPKPACVE